MSEVAKFIEKNLQKKQITIPWEFHTLIRFDDIAFISIDINKFKLDDQYYKHIHIEENDECDLTVVKLFENMENVCFLAAILHESYYDNIFAIMEDGHGVDGIFTDEYLDEAWNYAAKHNRHIKLMGDIIKKLGYRPKKTKRRIKNLLNITLEGVS